MTVKMYTKPGCVQCNATARELDKLGIDYTKVDVSADQSAYETVTALGYRQLPVIEAGEAHWSGFRPDMIATLA